MLSGKNKPGILQKTVGNIIFKTLDKNGDGVLNGDEAGGIFKKYGNNNNAITYSKPNNSRNQNPQNNCKNEEYYNSVSRSPEYKEIHSNQYPSQSYSKKYPNSRFSEIVEYQDYDYNSRKYHHSPKSTSKETIEYFPERHHKREITHSLDNEVVILPALTYKDSWHEKNQNLTNKEVISYQEIGRSQGDREISRVNNSSQPELLLANLMQQKTSSVNSNYLPRYQISGPQYQIPGPILPDSNLGYPMIGSTITNAHPGYPVMGSMMLCGDPGYPNSMSQKTILGNSRFGDAYPSSTMTNQLYPPQFDSNNNGIGSVYPIVDGISDNSISSNRMPMPEIGFKM